MGLRRTLASLRGRASTDDAPPAAVLHARGLTAERQWAEAAEAWAGVARSGDPDLGPEPWIELARARRLSRDLSAACDAVARGRDAYPDELRLLVEQARIALRGYASSNEDDRHSWKARLIEAQELLATMRALDRVSKPALQAAAEIELVRRRWDDAVDLWAEVERRYPDRADEAVIKQATALRARGDLEAARTTLDRASAAARETTDGRALARTIAADERVADANAIFAAASVRWHAGERGVLRAELPEAIVRRGLPEERVTRILPLLDDLSAFLDAAAADNLDSGPEPSSAMTDAIGDARESVAVSGFLYSGSGAVFDLLRQYEEFHLPFGDRETGFLKKPGHLATIVEGADTPRMPDPGTVADAVLASSVGFGQTGRPLFGWVTKDDAAVDRLVRQLRWLIAELRTTWATVGDTREVALPRTIAAIRSLLDAYVADRTPAGHRALLNNTIVGHQLDRLSLLSRAVAVAVLRDPRDQYVSQRLESPFAMSCEDFTAMMADRYQRYATLLTAADLRERVVTVGFERFVSDVDERAALVDRLAVAVDRPLGASIFDAERSRRNIGIHRDYADQREIRHIAEALLDPYRTLVGSA